MVSWVCELFPNMWCRPSQRSRPEAARAAPELVIGANRREWGGGWLLPRGGQPVCLPDPEGMGAPGKKTRPQPMGPEWQALRWVTEELGLPAFEVSNAWPFAKGRTFPVRCTEYAFCLCPLLLFPVQWGRQPQTIPCVPTPCSRYPGTPLL